MQEDFVISYSRRIGCLLFLVLDEISFSIICLPDSYITFTLLGNLDYPNIKIYPQLYSLKKFQIDFYLEHPKY